MDDKNRQEDQQEQTPDENNEKAKNNQEVTEPGDGEERPTEEAV